MGLSVLALATPIFGFILVPPAPMAPPAAVPANLDLSSPALLMLPMDEDGESSEASDSGDGEQLDMKEYSAQLKERAELRGIHKPLGIATWAAMGVALILGGIQYHNLYGFFDGRDDNPCVTGDAIFGQGQCSGTPWLHLTSGLVTAGLYTATFTLAALMPDPDNADQGDSAYNKNVRLHKLLRWVHFGGMVAQMLFGFVIANGQSFGLDRSNDYGTLQALSTLHLGVGLVTFGAMSWAMAILW